VLSDSEDLHAVQLADSLYHPLLRYYLLSSAASQNTTHDDELRQWLVDAYQRDYQSSASSSSPVRRAIGLGTVVTLLSAEIFNDAHLPRDILRVIPATCFSGGGNSRQNREEARLSAQLADSFRKSQLILARACLQAESTTAVDAASADRLLEFAAESLGRYRHSMFCATC
jgi:hypothetical protein